MTIPMTKCSSLKILGPAILCGVASVALVLQGCAQAVVAKTENTIAAVQTKAEMIQQDNIGQASTGGVVRTSRPRLSGDEIAIKQPDPLPEVLTRKITYSTTGAQNLIEVLQALSQTIGVTIRGSEITSSQSTQQGGASATTGNPTGTLTGSVKLEYVDRPVVGLLDEIAAQNDASWRYIKRANAIEFFRYESKTFNVYLPPGAKSINASISLSGVTGASGGGGGGGGGGSSSGAGGSGGGDVSVSQKLTVDPWSSIMGGISSILTEGGSQPAIGASGGPSTGQGAQSGGGSQGSSAMTASGRSGRATANPELGIISVTARPAALERIATYVSSINSRFAQNVMVDIKIYSLTLSQAGNYGFSLDLLYQKLNDYGLQLVGPTPLAPDSAPGQITIDARRGRFAGTNLIVQALSQFGNVALQTQGQVLAVNGQPAPIQVASEINYLASSATTQAANVGTTATLTPGTRVVGFTANFLPLIVGDNRILLQYQMQISSLTALTQVNSGTGVIQTPQIASQSLQQQAFVKDGQSIVLFGFDQNRDAADAAAGVTGASKNAKSERQMMVIVMQVSGGRKNADI